MTEVRPRRVRMRKTMTREETMRMPDTVLISESLSSSSWWSAGGLREGLRILFDLLRDLRDLRDLTC